MSFFKTPGHLRSKRVYTKRDVPRLYVQAIFALAAALALSTSACGKKDDSPTPVPAAAKAAPATTNTNDIGKIKLAGTAGASELDKQSGTPSTVREKRGDVQAKAVTTSDGVSNESITPEPDELHTLFPKKEDEVIPEPSVTDYKEPDLESVVYYDKNGETSEQIFAKKKAVIAEGAYLGEKVRSDIVSTNGDDLYYTGSAPDNLRDLLYAKVNERLAKQDPVIRAGDKELAQTIQLANFNVDFDTRRAVLNFKLERIGSKGKPVMSYVTMEGPLDNVAKFYVKSKRHKMAAEVACMDISGGCKTVHIRVQDRSTGNIQTAHLIARHTNAKVFFDEMNAPGINQNAEYDRLFRVFENTALISAKQAPLSYNYVDQLTMTTSETIGGASNFTVTMKMFLQNQYGERGGDTIELTGPLAKPLRRDTLNVGVNISPALTVIDDEIVPTSAIGTQQRFVDTISNSRLTRNDGQGNLQLELTIRNATVEAMPEKIRMRISRVNTPVQTTRIPMQ